MGLLIISRADARTQGLKKFFSGVPCPSGHVAERAVSNGTCVVCAVERNAKWREANPERAYNQNVRAYARNKGAIIKRAQEWAASNPKRRREISNSWAASHKFEMALYRMSVRARKAGCDDDLTLDELRAISVQQPACRYCASDVALSFDHVVSLAKGGPNTKTNIQVLCLPCNNAKRTTDEAEFLARRNAA